MLFEKSSGNIDGVLNLMDAFPLEKAEKIFKFWSEITMPQEEREKRMRAKADTAAQEASDKLINAKMLEEDDKLNNFLEIYKRKT